MSESFVDLGEQSLKDIVRPVRVCVTTPDGSEFEAHRRLRIWNVRTEGSGFDRFGKHIAKLGIVFVDSVDGSLNGTRDAASRLRISLRAFVRRLPTRRTASTPMTQSVTISEAASASP
jgi:hypothetical protein